jgi:GntR family transcriptional regulator
VTWEFSNDRPIYAQLVEAIRLGIVSGRYPPGSKLPSVRELAAEAAVNPNTMQKALSELEGTGLVYTQRTSGRFITEDTDMIELARKQLARQQLEDFLTSMHRLGYDDQRTLEILRDLMQERERT